jgi:hemerythrin-like domain-containing protein
MAMTRKKVTVRLRVDLTAKEADALARQAERYIHGVRSMDARLRREHAAVARVARKILEALRRLERKRGTEDGKKKTVAGI